MLYRFCAHFACACYTHLHTYIHENVGTAPQHALWEGNFLYKRTHTYAYRRIHTHIEDRIHTGELYEGLDDEAGAGVVTTAAAVVVSGSVTAMTDSSPT
jgi:hypothetical protein